MASLAAFGPQPGERGRGAELEGPGLLIARDRDRRSKASLAGRNVCRIAPEQQLAPKAMQLGLVKAFRPIPDDAEGLVENREPLIDAVRFVTYFGNQGEETRLPESSACRSEIGQPLPHLRDALFRLLSALAQRPTVQDGPHRPPERIAVLATEPDGCLRQFLCAGHFAAELAEPRGPDQGQSSAVRMREFLSQSERPLAPVEGMVGKAQKPPGESCIGETHDARINAVGIGMRSQQLCIVKC